MPSLKIVTPGPNNTLKDENGKTVVPPLGWKFLPAGDAGVTRRVTAATDCWRVQVKMGRRTISKGIWASADVIEKALHDMAATRQTDSYQKKTEAAKQRREKVQNQYTEDFYEEVRRFLDFHPSYESEACKMARMVCDHGTPVGSGTVARTTRIPIEERAARAVIAWMRHQTTGYDDMKIARIKGERRKVRRMLAERSVQLLNAYRKGEVVAENCPLKKALN